MFINKGVLADELSVAAFVVVTTIVVASIVVVVAIVVVVVAIVVVVAVHYDSKQPDSDSYFPTSEGVSKVSKRANE